MSRRSRGDWERADRTAASAIVRSSAITIAVAFLAKSAAGSLAIEAPGWRARE